MTDMEKFIEENSDEFNELTQEEIDAPLDWKELRKEKALDLTNASSAILEAWTMKGLLTKINKLNTRIVNSGNTLLNVVDGNTFFKYSAIIHYAYIKTKRIQHPLNVEVNATTEKRVQGLGSIDRINTHIEAVDIKTIKQELQIGKKF